MDMRLTEDEFLMVFVGVHKIHEFDTLTTEAGSVVNSAIVTGLPSERPLRIWYDMASQSYVTARGALYACRRHPRFQVA